MTKKIDLENNPVLSGYFDIKNEDSGLLCDICALTEILPEVVMASDGSTFDLARAGIEISYVIEHLKEIRDELLKGGEA